MPQSIALVEDQYVVRGGLLGNAQFGQGAVMSDQDASRIRNLIDRNPMAAVPKTPWPTPTAILAESSPPPLLPQPPIETGETTLQPEVVDFHTDVRFPGQVSHLRPGHPAAGAADAGESGGQRGRRHGVPIEFVTPEPQPVLVVCNAEGFIVEPRTRSMRRARSWSTRTATRSGPSSC